MLCDPVPEFDPANDTHYAISENAAFRLKSVHESAMAQAQLLDEHAPDDEFVAKYQVAAMMRALAYGIEGALTEHAVVFPVREAKP